MTKNAKSVISFEKFCKFCKTTANNDSYPHWGILLIKKIKTKVRNWLKIAIVLEKNDTEDWNH